MSVGVPGPRATLGHNIATAPTARFTIDPNDPQVRRRPLSEALAEADAEMHGSYFENANASLAKRRLTSSSKDEQSKEEDGKDNEKSTQPRSLLKRLFKVR